MLTTLASLGGLVPGSLLPPSAVELRDEVIACEMRLAFYDETTEALVQLDGDDETLNKSQIRLHALVEETVRLEALVLVPALYMLVPVRCLGRRASHPAPPLPQRPSAGLVRL